ncbi:MAG: ComEC/Rec2 family competence protein [Acidimicrobiales bacterium]
MSAAAAPGPPDQAEGEAEAEGADDARPPVLGDGAVAAMALAAAAGAWWAAPPALPLLLPGSALVGLVALRRARVVPLVAATLLLTASLGQRALAGLDPAPAQQLTAVDAVLVTDPETGVAGTTAIARVHGRRVELWAHGSSAGALRRAWAGDVVTVTGQQRPMLEEDIRRAAWRRVVGEVQVTSLTGVRSGGPVAGAANELHRRLERGARSLPDGDRALYAGLVLGDDRNQPVVLRDAFDAVGLSHLLAVSGQNVAFVLAAAAPLLVRLRLVARWVTVLSLLAFFAVLTRFEPSVLRAVTMAGLAATATALGRPASGLRVLGLAVTLLLVVDPLLVRSLGFQLSVLASGGILVGAPLLARWSRLPAPLAVAVSVPLAAQLATTPLLAARSGGLSLMSVVANVLVEPAAGAVMTWGSSVGLLAGYLPEPLAAAVTVPARVLLW